MRRNSAIKEAGQLALPLVPTASIAPIMQGVGNYPASPYKLPQDQVAQKLIGSRDALYSRVTTALGPIQSNISTHPLRGLTPARISSIQSQVRVAGYMVDWACLVEDVMRGDTEVKALDKSGREAVTGAPLSVEPADGTEEARSVADYQAAVISQIPEWDRAVERLMLGNSQGYALEEAIFEDRSVTFSAGDTPVTVTCPTPSDFENIHAKHTRWDIGRGDLLEIDTGGKFVSPLETPHKFLYYQASDDYSVRLRGYMAQAVWLCLIKATAWAKWAALLEIWGLRAPFGKATIEQWQDPVRRAEMLQALIDWGQGRPSVFTDDFSIEASAGITDGDTRGMHASLITAINLELSKLILGSTLTTEVSGTGSYNASETHADTKQARVIGWERNLSSCVREWMRACLKLACYIVNPDGSFGGVNPQGLSAQLGITPERCIALCGRPSWRVQREVTPQVRMGLYDMAVNKLGLEIDSDAPYREFGFPKARHSSKKIKGAPVVLAGDAATTSTSGALDGATNPKPEAAPSATPPKDS